MQQKNVPLPSNILSLWWWYMDESYNPWILSELITEAISKRWYEVLQYNNCLWLEELRSHWINFLVNHFGLLSLDFDEIMITNWATAWIDLASRYVLQWKYNSIVFSPIYDTALESLKRNSKDVISLPLNLFWEENWELIDWVRLEEIMKQETTKLVYINPNFHNPTWIVFDENFKRKIYDLAKKYWVIILEDDPYKLYNFWNSELWSNIVDMDEWKDNVIYLNSVSKVFFPWVRIWFLVSNPEFIRWISELQKYSTSSPNLIMQWAIIEAFERWEIDKSIAYYTREIEEKSLIIISEMKKNWIIWDNSIIDFSNSKWWFYLWGKFRNWLNTTDLQKEAIKNHWVTFVPWKIYWKQDEYSDSLRIAYAQISKQDIPEAVKRFKELLLSKDII